MYFIRRCFMGTPNKQLPPERKALYYGGMGLTGVGFLLFISVFFTGAANFGNFDHFEERARSEMFRAITGMVLMMAGGFMMRVGAKGWAGSGVVLDPEKAREDVEPWSRMAGGVAQDALSEVEMVKKIEDRLEASPPAVKIRCQKCQALNDEAAKFCNQCGASI
jgi:hypothetical protein